MQDSTMYPQSTSTHMESGRLKNLKEMRRVLEYQGSIFFEKTLPRSSAHNLHNSKSCLGIPRWFIDSHGDKFRKIVYLVAGPTTRSWTLRIYIKGTRIHVSRSRMKDPSITLHRGWNEFATFHGLVENDRLIFALKAMSTFEVYIFHPTGEPKESSFPTSREPSIAVQELLQEKVYEKSGERATNLRGKGKTAAQLVKDQVAQQLNARRDRARKFELNARRKKDAIPFQEPLQCALDIFEPHFIHNYAVQCHRFPEVIGQEPTDDVHQELVMPFTKNFVETKITSVGFEDKNQAQTQSQTSPPTFLSPSTFRNFNNLIGNMRVQAVVVLNGIPEMNGGAGDRAYNVLPAVQSVPSAAVQSDPSPDVQFDSSAAAQCDHSAVVQSALSAVGQFDPPAVVQPLVAESARGCEQPIVTVPTASGGTMRKHHRPWTLGEVMSLVDGVAGCGVGKWAEIKKLGFSSVGYRTVVDLKDKWRNLVRASEAQLHPAKQGQRKKQLPSIPAPILARVRELASLPNQIPPGTVYVSSASRKWQIVYRK